MMSLSDLIHKSKSGQVTTLTVATQDTETLANVAKVATVTVAIPQESKNTDLSVICLTPAGNPMPVKARDAEHAAFFLKMNPKPAQLLLTDSPDSDDRRHCADCGNLANSGRCLAALHGSIEAGSHYKPVDDCPRRCVGYVPKANENDQRNGAQRWPNLKP